MRVNKYIFLTILVLGASCNAHAQDMSAWSDKTVCRLIKAQTESADYIAEAKDRGLNCVSSTSNIESDQVVVASLKFKKIPKMAQSPLRDLKVPKDWKLSLNVANRHAFMQKFGGFHVDTGFINSWDMKEYIGDCEKELATFSPKWINNKSNPYQLAAPSNFIHCETVFVHRHFNNPEKGLNPFENIMLAWAETDPVKFPHRGANKIALMGQGYSAMMLIGNFAAFYAVHYEDFQFTREQRAQVDKYFSNWFAQNDITSRPGLRPCDLKNPKRQTYANSKIDTDNCGSNRWRMAIGGILLGLRTGDQLLFDAGVRHLEVALATIDKNGIFVSWANKGALAYSYTRQLPEVLTILATAFESIGYDFYEHRTPQGKKIHEVYEAFFLAMENPDLLYRHGKQSWNYIGENLWKFKKLPVEEQLLDEMVYLEQQVQASIGYVARYRPDLSHLLNYKRDWSVHWNNHLGVFTSVSGVMVHEIAAESDLANKLEALPEPSDFDFSNYDLVNHSIPMDCEVRVYRQFDENDQKDQIARAQAVLHGTGVEFYNESWGTGPKHGNPNPLANGANLKLTKLHGLVGRAPIFTMFLDDDEQAYDPVYFSYEGQQQNTFDYSASSRVPSHGISTYIKLNNCEEKTSAFKMDNRERITLKKSRDHTLQGLLNLLQSELNWQQSLDEALVIEPSAMPITDSDGEYRLKWYWVSNFDGEVTIRADDFLSVNNGAVVIETGSTFKEDPVDSMRQNVNFNVTQEGLLTANGELQFESDMPIEVMEFKGLLANKFAIGYQSWGNIPVLIIEKLD